MSSALFVVQIITIIVIVFFCSSFMKKKVTFDFWLLALRLIRLLQVKLETLVVDWNYPKKEHWGGSVKSNNVCGRFLSVLRDTPTGFSGTWSIVQYCETALKRTNAGWKPDCHKSTSWTVTIQVLSEVHDRSQTLTATAQRGTQRSKEATVPLTYAVEE